MRGRFRQEEHSVSSEQWTGLTPGFRANGARGSAVTEGFVSLRRVLDRLPDAVFILDQEGRVLDLNVAAEQALSRPRSEVAGTTLREIQAPAVLITRFEEALRQVVREERPLDGIVAIETARGTRQWHVQLFPDAGNEHEIPSVLAIARDVTRAKRRERELVARSNELSQLGDSMCHDLRSPLATIRSFLAFLLEDLKARDEAAMGEDVAAIQGAIERMGDLISGIVDRSRPGGSAGALVEVSFGDVIQDALTLVAGCIADRDAVVEVTGDPWMIRGDRGSLVEVFENLIENAVKFSKPGERPRIAVTVDDWGGSPVVSVRDEGIGIEPARLQRIFDPFVRPDAPREGTGVGLSVVRRLVARHGGKIWVESRGLDCGVTVRLRFAGMYRRQTDDA